MLCSCKKTEVCVEVDAGIVSEACCNKTSATVRVVLRKWYANENYLQYIGQGQVLLRYEKRSSLEAIPTATVFSL